MAVLPIPSSHLELTISVPGFVSSPSPPSSGDRGGSMVRDLDINRTPDGEDEWITASMEDEEESCNTNGGAAAPRKKLRLEKEQTRLLEESFRQNHTLNPKQKEALALQLNLRPRQVEVWFQNRRARSKLRQSEMECEYLKRWFGSLTEQNRRLQREVEVLRAMKVAPPTVISPHSCEPLPASALTMCPRCERVTTTTTAAFDKGSTKMTVAATIGTTAAALSSKVGTEALQSRPSSAAC
ncbi:Homeobox-leucine zipper protein HOX3 [Hibiscus syriacus]|uniref:Homeobox-leucine zipper protein HOX3 n=1 Tax=Hibiscus syriacus TaxID=106335 RepID=A0A6A3A738_HIBSY|nr:homeobox-leucine zipper protein HOX3-like [Hibiscus syriacus]KAE8698995.1 Homeobox-leucine zipper protein HOX3 [Hibiscus syriacus]